MYTYVCIYIYIYTHTKEITYVDIGNIYNHLYIVVCMHTGIYIFIDICMCKPLARASQKEKRKNDLLSPGKQ